MSDSARTPKIIFENEEIIAVDKPIEWSSAPLASGGQDQNIVQWLSDLRPELPRPLGFERERGLMHRLDRDTSGLLIFARDELVFFKLKTAWKTPEVRKYYQAVTPLAWPNRKLPVFLEEPIGASPKSAKKMQIVRTALDYRLTKPQPAITEIQTQQTISLPGIPTATELSIHIYTGVRHQIRCHLSDFGFPILGDTIYKGAPFSRLCLHSSKWSWKPAGKPLLEIECPILDWNP